MDGWIGEKAKEKADSQIGDHAIKNGTVADSFELAILPVPASRSACSATLPFCLVAFVYVEMCIYWGSKIEVYNSQRGSFCR